MPSSTKKLSGWKEYSIESSFLYVHPSCESLVLKRNRTVAIIGFTLDPTLEFGSANEIIEAIESSGTIEELSGILYRLSGRFIIIIKDKQKWLFFGDACGLRKLYYHHVENLIYAASDPLLINEFKKLVPTRGYMEFFSSNYYQKHPEFYLPINCTLFEEVNRLVPNHYYDSLTGRQSRFWPVEERVEIDLNKAVPKFNNILINIG